MKAFTTHAVIHKTSYFRLLVLWCLIGLVIPAPLVAAEVPPPDIASYVIDVVYEPSAHTIDGTAHATYVNRTDVAIPDLVFHLYLNAFRSESTLWMREAGPIQRRAGYDPDAPGWIDITQITLEDGTPLSLVALDADKTLMRANLPEAVPSGESVTVVLAFTAQLPRVFARTGWADKDKFVMAGQWFPKFGVWQDGAWNAYPFHANSEFYADFGSYDVRLTLPAGWTVGATGDPPPPPEPAGEGTVVYDLHADHVIDFAWTASPKYRVITKDVEGVSLRLLTYPGQLSSAKRALKATEGALVAYNAWYGPYGRGLYPQLTIVMVPEDATGAGGMEYPTLFTVGAFGSNAPACIRMLEVETVHELGHQWFQSMVATNEAEEPWLDEGFTDYSATRAMASLYDGAAFDCGSWNISYLATRRAEYQLGAEIPMAGKAWDFDGISYGIGTYSKPVLALTTLERVVGEAEMDTFLRTYVDRYAFSHPTAEDVRAVMAETLGESHASRFFEGLVEDDGTLDHRIVSFTEGVSGEPEITPRDHVALERLGELCWPTVVRITSREDKGDALTTEDIPWSCEDTQWEASADTIASVMIDPENALLLDLDLANNSRQRGFDWAAWLGISVQLLRILQKLFQGGGLL